MATQTIRCIYCDFTAKCSSVDKEGNTVKGLDALKEHTELKHPEVVKRSRLDDIRQMQKSIRETKLPEGVELEVFEIDTLDGNGPSGVLLSLEKLCAQCDYKEPSEGGWCYLFKDKPVNGCAKFKPVRG